MQTVATRLITLILILQNRPNQKAAELASTLGVSIRTLHRYMGMLDEMGIPVYSERGPQGGFSLVRGYKLPPLVFSLEEAVAVCLGTGLVDELWGPLYRDAARGAMAKLENILPDEQRSEIDWARRSLVMTGFHRADPASLSPVLETLRSAAREQVRVSVSYQSGSTTNTTKRVIDPYALIFRAGWWYLVGYCHLRGGPRTFRLDRIRDLKILKESFQLPGEFNIREYLENEFKDQPVIRARLKFVAEAAPIVRSNHALWETLQENPDGTLVATLTSPDLRWLASMALSFADWVTVLEPAELRIMVRDWARVTAALYGDS